MLELTLNQMLVMASLIAVGYLLRRLKALPESASVVMSRLEVYALVPALSLYTQITKCSVSHFLDNMHLMVYGLVAVLVCIAVAIPLSAVFAKGGYIRNVYKYALTFGNYGYMGNFIVLELFGSDVFYRYTLVSFFVGLACSSWGLYILIPKEKGASLIENIKRFFKTPPFPALLIGMLIGLTGLSRYVPGFLLKALENAGNCQGPVAMLLAGFVIGGFDIKRLFKNTRVYAVTLLRLVVIPVLMAAVLKAIGTDSMTVTLLLVAFATPIGLNTVVYPTAYSTEVETGAAMTVVSHLLSVVTLPFMFYLFV